MSWVLILLIMIIGGHVFSIIVITEYIERRTEQKDEDENPSIEDIIK